MFAYYLLILVCNLFVQTTIVILRKIHIPFNGTRFLAGAEKKYFNEYCENVLIFEAIVNFFIPSSFLSLLSHFFLFLLKSKRRNK